MTDIGSENFLANHYSGLYLKEKHDSPDESRLDLIARLVELSRELPNANMLNIGSGPQSLERQMLSRNNKEFSGWQITTVDIASIMPKKLLAGKNQNVDHVRSSGGELPFGVKSFDVVVSNLAIDFMPESALDEASRVLKEEGIALFNFHHPNMIPDDLMKHVKVKRVREFWQHLRVNDLLFDSEERIREVLTKKGFAVTRVALEDDGGVNKWWSVECVKS